MQYNIVYLHTYYCKVDIHKLGLAVIFKEVVLLICRLKYNLKQIALPTRKILNLILRLKHIYAFIRQCSIFDDHVFMDKSCRNL